MKTRRPSPPDLHPEWDFTQDPFFSPAVRKKLKRESKVKVKVNPKSEGVQAISFEMVR